MQQLVVERVPMLEAAVIPEFLAVIRQDEHRVSTRRVQLRQQPRDLVIGVGEVVVVAVSQVLLAFFPQLRGDALNDSALAPV